VCVFYVHRSETVCVCVFMCIEDRVGVCVCVCVLYVHRSENVCVCFMCIV